MQQRGAEYGTAPRRDRWRLVGPMHLAETAEQAIEDVRFGLDDWADYTQHVLAAPHFRAAGSTFAERVEWVNETGLGVIGTPDMAIAQIERLEAQSGGFGWYMMMQHQRALARGHRAQLRAVRPPRRAAFQGTAERLRAAAEYARSRWSELDRAQADAIRAATDRHAAERGARRRGSDAVTAWTTR